MTRNDPFIAQLEDYLEEFDGVTPLPDRVRDAIRAELPSARQVHPKPGLRRMYAMLSFASAGAKVGVAAAVIVAVVLGAAFVNNRNSGFIGVGAAPAPTAPPAMLAHAPTAACDATDTAMSCLAAGIYQLSGSPGEWPVTVTFDVPAGWVEWQAGNGFDGVLVDGGPTNRGNSGWGVMFATVAQVARNPCDPQSDLLPANQTDTPQKLAAAMTAWQGFTATAPQPITVDGHRGLKLQLTLATASTCGGPLWLTTTGSTMNGYPMTGYPTSAVGTYEIVDTGQGLLVIRATDFPQTTPNELDSRVAADPNRHAADQVAMHAILDSIRLSPLPASS
jgi:hypothetical protein